MAVAAPAPARAEIVSLFRSLLRVAHKFPDYKIREYAKQRTIDDFHQNKALFDAKSQLKISVVYSPYAHKVKSIMDIHNK